MQYEVSLLREDGRRLRPGEKPRKAHGCLTIGFEEQRYDNAMPRRVAILWVLDRWSSAEHRRTLLGPLFKPRMISLDDDAVLTIAGIEMRTTDAGTFEHNQVWRCRLLNGTRDPQRVKAAQHIDKATATPTPSAADTTVIQAASRCS